VKFLIKSYKDVKENREIIFSFRTYYLAFFAFIHALDLRQIQITKRE